ncbi:MAG: leucine-rich repeat protein [Oscillospiraceae bacterium]|nr:leucine-rich repeat protein [Oscillospiraceae bacterium]
MKKFKKILTAILVCCLSISFVPMADAVGVSVSTSTSITSGTIDNLTWSLSIVTKITSVLGIENTEKTGTLTISGTGNMSNYDYESSPWRSDCDLITSVVIKDGVTSIGDYAFSDYNNLETVTIPTSITNINDYSFSGCTSLISIYYAGGEGDWDAVEIGIENDYLTAAAIYYNSTGTDDSDVDSEEGVTWILVDGVLTISGIGEMEDYTFTIDVPWYSRRSEITTVIIQDGVTSIGGYAFNGCSNLTNITIPNSITYIGSFVFMFCRNLTDIYYSGSESEWKEISISGGNSSYLTSATIHYNSTGAASNTSTPGDLNGDGEVNASDLTILARHVGKVETMEDETALANADVTGDGNVDASDLTKLAQYIGKIISSLD